MGRKQTILIVAVVMLLIPLTANALPGAIFTTLEDGSRVNANIYQDREDVYLDGGPGQNAPPDAAGLPEGDYYYMVTGPDGKDNLSLYPIECRRFHVGPDGMIDYVYPATCLGSRKYKSTYIDCTPNTGIDQDHWELGAITVQLWPFKKTPNNGNVYKVWITPVDNYDPEDSGTCHGFPHFCSKTDNFKTEHGKPFDPPILEIRKFHDLNGNGIWDSAEPEKIGWQIEITDPLGVTNIYYTPVEIQTVPPGIWTIVEETVPHWEQTALYIDNVNQPVSTIAQVQVFGDSGEAHLVVYGNVQLGDIIGCKYYDRNLNRYRDSGEPLIPNWKINLDGEAFNGIVVSRKGHTDENGCVAFTNLFPGNYILSEVISSNWSASTDTSFAITLLGGDVRTKEFGNYCTGYANFDTKGGWHSEEGLKKISQTNIDYVNVLDPYDSDTEYWESEPFDGVWIPLNPGNYFGIGAWAEISDYLVSPVSAAPARFQLAQQLLALTLNCLNRLDDPGATIQLPNGIWMTASDLINLACSIWANGTDAQRISIKNKLDLLNNNNEVSFIPYNPCTVVYP